MFKKKELKIKTENGSVVRCWVNGEEGSLAGSGSRSVFIFGKKFVVKFDDPNGDNTGIQNDREIENYKKIQDEDKKYFASILFTGKIRGKVYIVQEFVRNTKLANDKANKKFNKIARKYSLRDCFTSDYTIQNNHNVATTGGNFKLFDLGWEKKIPF